MQQQCYSNIVLNNENFFIIEPDRKSAIKMILNLAYKEDTVLILGRGHETIQQVNDLNIYLSDYDEVKKCLKAH